jgi:hypothetical protein
MIDTEFLQMTLVGYSTPVEPKFFVNSGKLNLAWAGRSKAGWTVGPIAEPKPKQAMSAAARRRIALAQEAMGCVSCEQECRGRCAVLKGWDEK